MKNIAIVINTSWNIYNFRLDLLSTLKLQGYNIFCIAPRDEYSSILEDMGYNYRSVEMNNKGANPLEDIKLVYDYYKVFKDNKIDLLLLYTIKPNIYGNFAAKMAKIPTISTITGLGTVFLNDQLSSKIAKSLYKHSLKHSEQVFFQNSDDMQLFLDTKLLTDKTVDLVPGSGIDTEKFKPMGLHKENDCISFLFVARLVKDKGIMEFLEAAEILRKKYDNKISFYILGDFYANNPTALSKSELDIWIEKGVINYLGHTNDVKSVMEMHDCVVLPSYREGLSRVLLEAASMQKPIVTTDTPGCRDIVNDKNNGFFCQAKDSNDLAKAIEKMYLLSYEERALMGKRGRQKIIDNFSGTIVIKKYLDKIDYLLKEN